MHTLVSFISDFGLEDAYAAQVKARILAAYPTLTIVDITHTISAYNILSGAWLLFTAYSAFPEGTIHLAVVDPGVGTSRRVLVVEKHGHTFVGPDNGIFSFLYPAEKVTDVTWRPDGPIAPTFHGRDIFAPLVIKLLQGAATMDLGLSVSNPICLDVSSPQVVHIDHYGNIVTNILPAQIRGHSLSIQGRVIQEFMATFEDLPEGELGLITGSAGTIEIVARQKNAAEMLGAGIGTPLVLGPAS